MFIMVALPPAVTFCAVSVMLTGSVPFVVTVKFWYAHTPSMSDAMVAFVGIADVAFMGSVAFVGVVAIVAFIVPFIMGIRIGVMSWMSVSTGTVARAGYASASRSTAAKTHSLQSALGMMVVTRFTAVEFFPVTAASIHETVRLDPKYAESWVRTEVTQKVPLVLLYTGLVTGIGGAPKNPPYDALVYGSEVLRHRISLTRGYSPNAVETTVSGSDSFLRSPPHPARMV